MTNTLFTIFKTNLFEKLVDLVNDSFNIGLLSAYTITPSDTVWGTMTGATETSGTGYTAGGLALSGLAVTSSGTTAVWTSTSNPTWSSASFTAAYAVIYDVTVSNQLVGVIDFDGSQTVTSGTFELQWSTSPVSGSIVTLS
jgi:hypothetical protein